MIKQSHIYDAVGWFAMLGGIPTLLFSSLPSFISIIVIAIGLGFLLVAHGKEQAEQYLRRQRTTVE